MSRRACHIRSGKTIGGFRTEGYLNIIDEPKGISGISRIFEYHAAKRGYTGAIIVYSYRSVLALIICRKKILQRLKNANSIKITNL